METNALLAFENDIQNRSWLDWLRAHTSFLKPLHRYEGVLTLYSDRLRFVGRDRKTGEEVSFEIFKYQIEQLYMEFDETFNAFEVRGLGLTWLPLRLKLSGNNEGETLYIITNYNFGRTDNQAWFDLLKEWLANVV